MEEMKLPEWFKEAEPGPCTAGAGAYQRGFVEKSLEKAAAFTRRLIEVDISASKKGLLQSIDARARLIGVLALVFAAAVAGRIETIAVLYAALILLTILSGVRVTILLKRVLPAFVFSIIIVSPLFLSVTGKGAEVFGFSVMGVRISFIEEGARIALFFLARVGLMASLVNLLVLTTRQADFFSSLGFLPVPRFFTTAVFMTFRYMFILLKTLEDAAYARKSRTISSFRRKEAQAWFSSRAMLLLKKSLSTAEELSMALASRGFSGTIKQFRRPPLGIKDYLWVGLSSFVFFLSAGL